MGTFDRSVKVLNVVSMFIPEQNYEERARMRDAIYRVLNAAVSNALAEQAIECAERRHQHVIAALEAERVTHAADKQKAVDANDTMWKVHYERAAKESERQHAEALAEADVRLGFLVEEECLRGEQALSLERRNWEAYREGEKGRIEAALAKAYDGLERVFQREIEECEKWPENARKSAVTWCRNIVREQRAKASPTGSPRDMTREETVDACLKRSDAPPRLIPFSYFVGQCSEHV